MAESASDRTEKATPRRLRRAREEGQVARSPEIESALILLIGITSCVLFKDALIDQWSAYYQSMCRDIPHVVGRDDGLMSALTGAARMYWSFMGSIFAAIAFTGVASGLAQTGFIFSPQSITPDISRLDPFAGFGRMFSMRSVFEILKTILKFGCLGLIAYGTIAITLSQAPFLIQLSPRPLASYMSGMLWRLAFNCFLFMIGIASFDYVNQRRQLATQLKMSKQEVKQEHRETEGNPQVKSKIRRLMRKMASKRNLKKVAEAQVVVTNPTHLAVALKYNPGMNAPVVLAKGADLLAEKIREIALKNDIPIVENRPLARLLYRWIEPGQEVPSSMYQAVAEVLAYVFRLRREKNNRRTM